MNKESDRFDFMALTGLGRKRKPKRDPKYAGFNRRMLAATLDSLLLMLLAPWFNQIAPIDHSGLVGLQLDETDPRRGQKLLMHVLSDDAFVSSWINNVTLQIIAFCIYSVVCWHFWAATPGKMLMRLKVVDAKTEKPISDLQGILRASSYFLSGTIFMLGFFWMGIDKKRRGWHDIIAETVVVIVPLWKKQPEEEAPPGTGEPAAGHDQADTTPSPEPKP